LQLTKNDDVMLNGEGRKELFQAGSVEKYWENPPRKTVGGNQVSDCAANLVMVKIKHDGYY